jgi:hypothetical protein
LETNAGPNPFHDGANCGSELYRMVEPQRNNLNHAS